MSIIVHMTFLQIPDSHYLISSLNYLCAYLSLSPLTSSVTSYNCFSLSSSSSSLSSSSIFHFNHIIPSPYNIQQHFPILKIFSTSYIPSIYIPISIPLNSKTPLKKKVVNIVSSLSLLNLLQSRFKPQYTSILATMSKLSTTQSSKLYDNVVKSHGHFPILISLNLSPPFAQRPSKSLSLRSPPTSVVDSYQTLVLFIFPTSKHWHVPGLSPGTSLLTFLLLLG